jgi:hypothetical protein
VQTLVQFTIVGALGVPPAGVTVMEADSVAAETYAGRRDFVAGAGAGMTTCNVTRTVCVPCVGLGADFADGDGTVLPPLHAAIINAVARSAEAKREVITIPKPPSS